MQETWVRSLGWEDSLGTGKAIHSVFWPGEFPGLYSPWGHKELNTTERLLLSETEKNHIESVKKEHKDTFKKCREQEQVIRN